MRLKRIAVLRASFEPSVLLLTVALLMGCSNEPTGERDGGLMEVASDAEVDGQVPPIHVGEPDAGRDGSTPQLDGNVPPGDARVPVDGSGDESDADVDGRVAEDAEVAVDANIEPDGSGPEPDAAIPDPATCTPWTALVEPDAVICEQEPPPDVGPFDNHVALTFDDGPNPATTPAILAILRAEHIPATFFMVGQRLQTDAARALALEIHRDPLFRVANHTFTHARLPDLELPQVAAQIDETSAAIRVALQDPCYFPRFVRFPYSDSDCSTMQVVRERGFAAAGLHIDTMDWCYARNAGHCAAVDEPDLPENYRDDMIGYVLSRLPEYGGGIVLMHDIHPNTAANLQALIDALQEAGVSFVALDDEAYFPVLNAQVEVPEPPACCEGVTR